MPYAIDLFCGAGGCSEGLIQAGFHILYSSDISPMVAQTYVHRHEQLGLVQGVNTYFQLADIRDLEGEEILNHIAELEIFNGEEVPDIDLMIGGPSCQGFSRAGRRDRRDPRNMLFGEYVRVINEIRPKYIVLENVEGFMDMQFLGYEGITGVRYPDGSVTPDILTNELNEIGYHTLEPRILNAADYGVPQRRNRVIFIGYRDDVAEPHYPEPLLDRDHHISLREAIGDLIEDPDIRQEVNPVLSEFQLQSRQGRTPDIHGNPIPSEEILNNEHSRVSDVVAERFSLFNIGETGSQIRKRIKDEGINLEDKPALLGLLSRAFDVTEREIIDLFLNPDQITQEHLDILLTKKNVRSKWDPTQPSATVVSIADDYISPWENRTFSVREMARCQGFDDSFEFLGKRTTGGILRRVEIPQYTQVGNAVPPLLARAIAAEILHVL